MLFMLFNYINIIDDKNQILKNNKSIASLTHIAEVQKDHLTHLDFEVASNCHFYLQQIKFNLALLVSACQDVTFRTNAFSDKFLPLV
jgi:hypothetical protein